MAVTADKPVCLCLNFTKYWHYNHNQAYVQWLISADHMRCNIDAFAQIVDSAEHFENANFRLICEFLVIVTHYSAKFRNDQKKFG